MAAKPILAVYGGLHSHRLAQRRQFYTTAHGTFCMDVQFHCMIEMASVEETKMSFSHTASTTQYEWNIERELSFVISCGSLLVWMFGNLDKSLWIKKYKNACRYFTDTDFLQIIEFTTFIS